MRSKPEAGTPGCAGGGGEGRRRRRMLGGAFLPCCLCPPCSPVPLPPLPDPSCNGDQGQRPDPNGWNRDEQTPLAHSSAILPKFVVNKGAYSVRDLSRHLELQMSGWLPKRWSPLLGSLLSSHRGIASLVSHQQKGRGQRQEDRSCATFPSRRLPSNAGCFLLLSDKFGSGRRSHHRHHRQPGAPSAARRANSQMVK